MRGGWSSPTPYTPMDGENKAITTKKKKKKKKKKKRFQLILQCLILPKMKIVVTKYVVCYSNIAPAIVIISALRVEF